MFEIFWESLSPDAPQAGRVGLLPWDCETFGFNVGQYDWGESERPAVEAADLGALLARWGEKNQVEVIAAWAEANRGDVTLLLQDAGFRLSDSTFVASYMTDAQAEIPETEVQLAPVTPEEMEVLADLAGRAFRNGRYHTDPRFPREMADRRYADWVRRATLDEDSQVLLGARYAGELYGFVCFRLDADRSGWITLVAVDPDKQNRGLGRELMIAAMTHCREAGGAALRTRFSALNGGVLHLHSSLNALFSPLEHVLHWYAPSAARLLNLSADSGKPDA